MISKASGGLFTAQPSSSRDGVSFYYDTPSTNTLGDLKEITSEYTGKYQPGVLRLNPVTIRRTVGSCPNVTAKTVHPSIPSYIRTGYGPYAACSGWQTGRRLDILNGTYLNSWIKGKSLVKAYSKLSSADWDAGIFAAELREAIQMIRNPASAFINQLFKQRRTPKLWRTLNAAAGTWLEGRYGWTPLVMDLLNAVDVYQTSIVKNLGTLEKKSARVISLSEYSITTRKPHVNYTMWCNWSISYSYSIKAVTSVYYTLQRARSWQESYGLTLNNIPNIIWEKIPFSFVLDWFIGVGGWLQATQPIPHIGNIRNCVSLKSSEVIVATLLNTEPYNGYLTLIAPHSKFSWNVEQLLRTVDDPVPQFPVVDPSMSSVKHIFDSACLLWQKNQKGLLNLSNSLRRKI